LPIRRFLNISEPSACNDDTLVSSGFYRRLLNYYAAGLTGRVKYLSSGMFLWPPLVFCSGRIVFSIYRNIWRRPQSLPQGPSSQSFFMRLAERVRRVGTNQARNWGCGRVRARVPGPSHSL